MKNIHRTLTFALAVTTLGLAIVRPALADDNWIGQGTDALWSDSANWTSNTPNNNYGTLYFNDNNSGKTNITDDITMSFAENALKWYDSSTWTINTTANTGVINLYDNGGTQSEIENFSTGSVTINIALTFAANNSRSGSNSNPYGQIDAVNGDLTFGSTGTLQVGGPSSTVDGIRMFGGTARTTTFNDTVNASNSTNGGVGDKYFALIGVVPSKATTGTGTNVTIGGTFNSGDIYVMNGSTLNVASGGTVNANAVRLGGDYGNTGYQNLALGGTLNLTATTGGQTFASVINPVTNNTSGALSVNSQNTSGVNTISSSIYLDSSLAINQAGGGNLVLSGGTIDLKSNTLSVGGAGVVNVTGTITSSINAGTLNYGGTGTLLLNATTYNGGATNVNSGTLGGTGTVNGAVNVNAATINPGAIGTAGSAAAVGTLTTGALTLVTTSTSVFDLASASNYDKLAANGAVTLGGNLSINLGSTIDPGTVVDLVHGTSLSGTFTGIDNNGTYTFGGEQFTALYTGTDFELVAVPEPATYLAGLLMVGVLGYGQRRRFRRAIAA